jgi:hypothetical protein
MAPAENGRKPPFETVSMQLAPGVIGLYSESLADAILSGQLQTVVMTVSACAQLCNGPETRICRLAVNGTARSKPGRRFETRSPASHTAGSRLVCRHTASEDVSTF